MSPNQFHRALLDIFGQGTNELMIQTIHDFPIQFNYGNYYTTAYNVWNSIIQPVIDPITN